MDGEADRMRKDVQEYLSAVVVSKIEVGGIGAVPTADTDADGYYLLEFTSEPYECHKSNQLIVKGKCLNPVKRAPKWCTKSELFDKHLVNHIVYASVRIDPISEDNQHLRGCLRKIAIEKEDDDYVIEEIIRREALEDPNYERFDNEEAAVLLVAKSTETIAQ